MSVETTYGSIIGLCEAELTRMVEEVESRPSRTAFFDLGAVAEVLMLAGSSELQVLRAFLTDTAAGWMKSGLLEDLLVARVEFAYHVALLSYLARGSASWSPSDTQTISDLYEGGLIARNEIPVLRQLLITAFLSRGSNARNDHDVERRRLGHLIDKRVLRARPFDELDVHALLMCAQLIQLQGDAANPIPRVQPQMQLIEAARGGNRNWLPVLTFLCSRFFGLPGKLRAAVFSTLRQFAPPAGQLLPPPRAAQMDSEHIERSEHGLSLRSTIAFVLCSYGHAVAS